jgi:FAD/FMN-containing dehydrogenase
MLTAPAIETLKKSLRGALLEPADAYYDPARKVWHGMIDKRPALIARCARAADVAACVGFAREHEVPLSVRGGGHNYAGKAVCEGGLMLDLSLMKGIEVDAARRVARAQAGLKLGEFDRATQKYGLATTLGVATTTGISGLTLGGGYGWLAGKYGLACDNLIRAEVVTADGNIKECSAQENADLFWALRGAGANFGIVTELEYTLYPVSTVLGGPIFHPLEEAALRFYDDLAHSAPDELTVLGSAMMGPGGVSAFATVVCYCGPPAEGEKLLKPLRGYATPLADMIQPRPYLEMQSLFDPDFPPGRRYYNKAHNLSAVSDGAIETVLRYSTGLPTFQSGSGIAFQQLHGVAGRIPTAATSFPHRYDHQVLWIGPVVDDPKDDERMIRWARECWEAMKPFADGAVYVNALDDVLEAGERPVREAYGANYERLHQLKKKYDPTNLFCQNSNIKPD